MSEVKKIQLEINGKKVEVAAGTTVFNAAVEAGVFIPHYCYHPDLSIAGVCRMCMVEIEKIPRPQISCNTVATEGMVVRTDTDKIKETVKSVLELHLINHPLDCPICDKAGECGLQNFYSSYGLYNSRMDFEKVHKPKVQDIGTIILDSERCILCTRCVRFTDEVTKTSELGIFQRGDRSTLQVYDGGELRNDYTGNLADICPVGALTAKDFRFQQRVWLLDKTVSVCGMCARGCNTSVSVNSKTQKLYRVEPRRNPEVNASWICDEGRWGYHYVSSADRLSLPKKYWDGVWRDHTWMDFFKEIQAEIKKSPAACLIGLSTQMTNEELWDLGQTLKSLGVTEVVRLANDVAVKEKTPFDGILKHNDVTPNAQGFEQVMKWLGLNWITLEAATAAMPRQSPEWVMCFGLEGDEKRLEFLAPLTSAVPRSSKLVLHATNPLTVMSRATWVVPNVTFFEKNGTFTNALNRLQRVKAALTWQGMSRDGHAVALGLRRGDDREAPNPRAGEGHFQKVVAPQTKNGDVSFKKFPALGEKLSEKGASHVHP